MTHISPIVSGDGKLVAAKSNVYAGEDDEYITFITSEAYLSLQSTDCARERQEAP